MIKTGRPVTSAASGAPYRLRGILIDHQISHADMRDRLLFETGMRAGQPMAPATFSALLNNRMWPKTIERAHIEQIVGAVLREKGVDADVINTVWDVDGVINAQTEPRKYAPVSDANPPPVAVPRFSLPETEMLSADATEHFTLAAHPFLNDVQGPKDVYLSKDQRYIRQAMHAAAKHGGFLAVVGESGSGKSTLRRDLINQILANGEPIVVVQPKCVDKRVLTAAHICNAIIADLSNETCKQDLEGKARQVERILIGSSREGGKHVLIIEEAHDLHISTLKYLKRFWEMEDGFKRLLGIVLVGQPELGARLNARVNPDAREVINRIEVATLASLNGNLEEYLALKFGRVDKMLADVFAPDAFDAIRARLTERLPNNKVRSHLYPLAVNNLVVLSMNIAARLGVPRVTADLVGGV